MLDLHTDARRFRDALEHTASTRGFAALLIEKDYYCTVVLNALASAFQHGLVFKGGTSLSKIHTDFFRLSEDLDFVVSVETSSARSTRRRLIAPIKEHIQAMMGRLPYLRLSKPMHGSNACKQYIGEVSYNSLVTGQEERIKVEVGLREPVLEPVEQRSARTLLTDPFRNAPAVGLIPIHALSFLETYAEKIRAALTRREPAIRDFFDIDHAMNAGKLDFANTRLLEPRPPEAGRTGERTG